MKKFTLLFVCSLFAGLFFAGTAWGQITQVTGSPQTSQTTGTTMTLTRPSGLAVGHVVFVQIVQSDDNGATLSDPVPTGAAAAGWQIIDSRNFATNNDNTWRGTLFYKVATSTDVSAANFQFTLDSDAEDGSSGGLLAFSGVNTTAGVTHTGAAGGPFDSDPGVINTSGNISTVTALATTINNANAGVVMFSFLGDNRDHTSTSWQLASGAQSMDQLYDAPYNSPLDNGIGAAFAIRTTTGTTGNGTVDLSGNARNGGILVALYPAPITSVSITPSVTQNISAGSSVNFSATANNFSGSGNYSYTWNVSPATGVVIPGSNPNSVASNTDSKAIVFNTPGSYTVNITISRGSTTLTTSSTTVNVFTVNAGPDQNITTTTASLTGSVSGPGTPTYSWSRVSGPNTPTITNGTTLNASLSGLVSGTYVYRLTVNGNAALIDEVTINVSLPPSVALSPSTAQSIFTGSTVNFTATASNYPGTGDYTYDWSVSPGGGVSIPGPDPNTIPGASDSKAIQFSNSGTFSVSVTISRGATVLNTLSTTVNVFAPNLWSVAGTGDLSRYTVDPVSGAILFGPGAVITPSTSTAAVGKNAPNPLDPDGCIYYLNRDGNPATLQGVVTVYAVRPNGTGNGIVGQIDMNGAANTSGFSFVRLGFDNSGRGWIIAGSGSNIYICSFEGRGVGTTITNVNTFGNNILTVAAPGSATDFQNGDLAISGNGTLYALANVTGGETYVYTLNSLSTPTTLTRRWTVQQNNTTFSGSVNGLAWTQSGSLHFSTDNGIYFIDQNTAATATGTVQATLISSVTGLTDLGSDRFPTQSTLPVTLGAFNAVKVGDFANVSWKTLTEENTSHFVVERSYDGVNFTEAATQRAVGNSTSEQNYQYSDPLNYNYNIVYYRLKSVDIDGKFSYSKIVAIRLAGGPVRELTVFPNPFTDNVKLQMSAPRETAATLRVSNAAGQVVLVRNIQLQKGDNIIVLSNGLDALQPGLHILEVISSEGKVAQKIIKR